MSSEKTAAHRHRRQPPRTPPRSRWWTSGELEGIEGDGRGGEVDRLQEFASNGATIMKNVVIIVGLVVALKSVNVTLPVAASDILEEQRRGAYYDRGRLRRAEPRVLADAVAGKA